MNGKLLTAGALAFLVAAPASAQSPDGNYRRFSQEPMDTNRSNRIVYVPLGWAFPGPRPATQPHDASSATWYQLPVGVRGVRPDKNLERAEYRLESFQPLPGDGRRLRVVITRTGGGDIGTPELAVVHTKSQISATGSPRVEAIPGGTRYTFVVTPPDLGVPGRAAAERYEIRFFPATEVPEPPRIARKPTFDGADPQVRAAQGPPRLPYAERVAGKRLEYRAGRQVVVDQRVAGSREERRR